MTLGTFFLDALASSALAAAILACIAFAFRHYAARWVNHQFDERLEAAKAEYKRQEEVLKDALTQHRLKIEALQSGALSGMAARHVLLDKKRIEALESVWAAVAYMHAYHNLSVMCAAIGFDTLSKVARDSPNGAAIIDSFLNMAPPFAELSEPDNPHYRIERQQLFVPPLVWAMFDAYRSIIFLPMMMLIAVKGGMDVSGMWDAARVQNLIKVALPDAQFDLGSRGAADLAKVAGPLKNRLLAVALESLENPATDTKSVEQAGKILRSAEELQLAIAAAGNSSVAVLAQKGL
ncbi:hypothetical protein [Reyranella sp.]|uniref:hypothetical protein n=1 Tax=Reyranella sp. TaxID=1929291 RepID=UPI00271E1AC1|nr:hypothetical protein [Reyranella sp.]MDO8973913.1 hypothetical protein [Reyranella sp.]MDP3243440.1 hypothetical protein [Reyranella sp.]